MHLQKPKTTKAREWTPDIKSGLQAKKPYQTNITRVHKTRVAPKDKVFLVVTYKDGKMRYANFVEVDPKQTTPELEEQIFEELWRQIKDKYKLDTALSSLINDL